MSSCTYKFTGPDGQERTIIGQAAMKAFLVDGGMEMFFPDGKYPWASNGPARDAQQSPQDFIPAPDGGLDYGEITPEMGRAMRRQAGVIRLQQGNDRFGLAHIEARHGDEIRKAGFASIQEFVSDIAKNIDQVWRPDSTSQLVALHMVKNDRVMFVQLQADSAGGQDFYTVNTAFPSRAGYVGNKKNWEMLWEGRAQPSQSATSEQTPFAAPPQRAGEAATIPSGQSTDSLPPTATAAQPSASKAPQQAIYTYTPASKIESPAVGALNNAKGRKEEAATRLKSVRQRVKDGTENRLELLKAEIAHKDAVRDFEQAQEHLEREANRMGLTTKRGSAGKALEGNETEGGNVALFRSIRTAKSAQTKLSQDAVEKAVASALNRVVGAPQVQVFATPADAGIDVPPGVIPKGVTLPDGSVFVFSDGAESVIDVFQTVFHELYHRGSKVRFTSNPDYITKMLEIASKDELVQQEVNAWKDTADGKDKWAEFQQRGPMTGDRLANFEALAVEEALATMAEKVAMGDVRKPETVIKQIARFLAKVANAWGMKRLALWLNTRSLAESEKFITETIGMSGGKANEFTTSVLFRSKAEDISARVGEAIKSVTATNLKQKAGFKATDYLGVGLQTLGRRQIVDIYGDMLPLAEYNRLVQQMEADKNEGGAGADQLVTRWAKLPDEGKLADLMHDATLAQIDPAKAYVDGDDKAKYLMLQRKFNLLSDEAKKVYTDARNSYQAHHAKVRSAIKERIERSELKGERKAALLKQMDDEFFQAIKGVYFPLARFGQYAVTVKGPDGKVESVSRAEGKAEAEALRNSLLSAFPRDKGFTVGRVMLTKEFVASRDSVGRGFMTELYNVLDKQDMDAAQRAELEDTLGQLYLSSLPDLSWAKHGIHRKGTPGFSQDARRAFAQNMFHGARYLAKLRYSDLMQDELNAMQKHVDDWREVDDFDQNSAQRVVDEMNKRHESLMNPQSNPLSTALTSFGFIFHLGLSPASAMVNLSQTALVAYPIMGAKWGFSKASAALLKASKQAMQGKNDITASLNADERAAYDEAVRAGTIDVTMAHDLAGIAQGEDAGVMWKMRPVMRWASIFFHHAERFNRQVTFVAAYRLARDTGADHNSAFEQATKATYDGHFDYSSANRPRFMQGNVAKVLLLFKQYAQNMVYTFTRNAYQAIKGTDAEKAEARKALAGLLTTHAMAAGVLGLPMVSTLLAAASMIGGDDDEPWDAKIALQNMLADTFGQKPAEVLAHGLSRLTPWDISGRVGLNQLIFPDIQEGLEGQRLWESVATQALGPVGGIVGGLFFKGPQLMSEGHYKEGLEAMLPAVLRQAVKSYRYASDGVQDKTGIVVKDEVSVAGVAGQLLGFSPSEVRLAQEGKSAVYQQDKALLERRQELLTKVARATMAKDEEAKADARKEIARFNEKNPTRRITPLNIAQSVRNRQKRIDQAEGGVYLPKNRRDAMDAGRFAQE